MDFVDSSLFSGWWIDLMVWILGFGASEYFLSGVVLVSVLWVLGGTGFLDLLVWRFARDLFVGVWFGLLLMVWGWLSGVEVGVALCCGDLWLPVVFFRFGFYIWVVGLFLGLVAIVVLGFINGCLWFVLGWWWVFCVYGLFAFGLRRARWVVLDCLLISFLGCLVVIGCGVWQMTNWWGGLFDCCGGLWILCLVLLVLFWVGLDWFVFVWVVVVRWLRLNLCVRV